MNKNCFSKTYKNDIKAGVFWFWVALIYVSHVYCLGSFFEPEAGEFIYDCRIYMNLRKQFEVMFIDFRESNTF